MTKADSVGAFLQLEHVDVEPTGSGLLDGLTCGVKDIFDIAGHVTGFGNPTWHETHGPAAKHAFVVERVLAEGARVVGKTHTDELAFSIAGNNFHYGAPINTAAPDRAVGGSSSGSAAAVAAGLCDFALGSDTAGSIRVPASFCGLFGIRTSHAAVSLEGACQLAPIFDTAGWFARDAETMLTVGKALLPMPQVAEPHPESHEFYLLTEGWSSTVTWEPSSDKSAVGRVLAELGNVRVGSFPADILDIWFEAFRTLQLYDVWRTLGPWVTETNPILGPGIAQRMLAASQINEGEAAWAAGIRRHVVKHVNETLAGGRIIVIPTVPGAAPLRTTTVAANEAYRKLAMRLLSIAGLCELPQVSVPMLRSEGAPLGLSLIGAKGADLTLLRIAQQLGSFEPFAS